MHKASSKRLTRKEAGDMVKDFKYLVVTNGRILCSLAARAKKKFWNYLL
jgi:hypothetical protein